jgi:hypothetical protein
LQAEQQILALEAAVREVVVLVAQEMLRQAQKMQSLLLETVALVQALIHHYLQLFRLALTLAEHVILLAAVVGQVIKQQGIRLAVLVVAAKAL